jgi:hypothetical protein
LRKRALSGRHSPPIIPRRLTGKIDRQMPLLTLATRLFDALAQLAPRISDPLSAKVSGTPSAPLNALAGAPEPNVGAPRFLVALGMIATTIAVVFFGLGLFLLARDLPVPVQRASAHARVFDHAGWDGARNIAPPVLPSALSSASAPESKGLFAAQWLAYALPCQPFAGILAGVNA